MTWHAYSRRAEEYTHLLGTIESVHPADLHLVTTWARSIDGPLLDVGCGPGQWTDHLANYSDIRGIDPTPEFVEHARSAFPTRRFDVGRAEAIDAPTGGVSGVLAWYSLIHHLPEEVVVPLHEFGRVLRPGGQLLVGFFVGRRIEGFDHAVTTAYRWPVDNMSDCLDAAGFDVVEAHTRSGPGYRPHGAIAATRRQHVVRKWQV